MEELELVFPKEVINDFEESLLYLFENRILRKSIRDKDDYKTMDRRESLKEDSLIYLSSKGEEMWRMLSQDSVLLELFREEVYRDYKNNDFNDNSSYELMSRGAQGEIFLDLLRYVEYLGYMEDDLRNRITEKLKRQKYKNMFGEDMMIKHLLAGIECSLRYSGKSEVPEIKQYLFQLKSRFGLN